ncbi:hypothetical protein [Sphingorhabdus sp.]|uniref:hypothetical protein n=1 Tax=Sphingorhabdus sp. TaxID=1902408 RepID=UPI0037C9972D
MTYMQSNLAFADGIQELSFDEIGFVSGGVDAYDSGNMRRRPEILDKNADRMRDRDVLKTGALYVGIGILAIAAAPVIAAGAAAAGAGAVTAGAIAIGVNVAGRALATGGGVMVGTTLAK